MAEQSLSRHWHALPRVVRIGIIYIAARIVTTGFLLLASYLSTPDSRWGANPGILRYLLGWDAQWYWLVAFQGYPAELPLKAAGYVAENAWAFMPVYAYLSEWIGLPFGAWGAGALIVSLVSGYLACLALYRLLRRHIDSSAAMWAVVFFAAGPLAALFQVGYAEALFLLLLFLALDATQRRRYGQLYLLIPVMAFTRPGILAFALFLALHGIARWRGRREEPLPLSEIAHILGIGALATATGFAWQFIAGAVTGQADAYIATELAWRRHWGAAEHGFVPFQGWAEAAMFWFGQWRLPGWLGIVFLAMLVLLAAWLLIFPARVRALGPQIRLWCAAYLIYLLAVFFPQFSTLRLLLPVSPLWGAVALARTLWFRCGVLGLCLIGQWLWIYTVYGMGNAFWHVP